MSDLPLAEVGGWTDIIICIVLALVTFSFFAWLFWLSGEDEE